MAGMLLRTRMACPEGSDDGDAFTGRIDSILVMWGSELVLLFFVKASQCITQTVLRAMKEKWGVRGYYRGTILTCES